MTTFSQAILNRIIDYDAAFVEQPLYQQYDAIHRNYVVVDAAVADDDATDNNEDDESRRARLNVERYTRQKLLLSVGELRELDCCAHTQLTAMPSVLLECRNLVHLSLVRTHVARVASLSRLVNLTFLDLSCNVLEDISELAANERLETLILDFNLIEFLPPCVFRRLQKLRWLSMRKTFVGDLNFAIESLQLLPELKVNIRF